MLQLHPMQSKLTLVEKYSDDIDSFSIFWEIHITVTCNLFVYKWLSYERGKIAQNVLILHIRIIRDETHQAADY